MHRIMCMASVHMLIILHNWSNSLGSPSLALPGFLIVYLSSPQQKSPCLFPLTWLPSSAHGKGNKQCVTNRYPVCVRGAWRWCARAHLCVCMWRPEVHMRCPPQCSLISETGSRSLHLELRDPSVSLVLRWERDITTPKTLREFRESQPLKLV